MPLKSLRQQQLDEKKKSETETLLEELRQKKKEVDLKELCGDDSVLYQVVSTAVLLNPEKLNKEGIKTHVEKAQMYEKSGDYLGAVVEYQVAGQLSLFYGNLEDTKKYFKKCAEIFPKRFKTLYVFFANRERAENVLKVAEEYYNRTKINQV